MDDVPFYMVKILLIDRYEVNPKMTKQYQM